MKQPVFLRIFLNDELIEVKQSTDSQIILGSGDSATVILPNDKVSGIHCMLEERDNGFFISDLGSDGGTFLDDEKVLDTQIESGQVINVGPYKVEFFIGVPKPMAAPKEKASPEKKQKTEDSKIDLNARAVSDATDLPDNVPKADSIPKKKKPFAKAKIPKDAPPEQEPVSVEDLIVAEPIKTDIKDLSTTETEFSIKTYAPKSDYTELSEILSPGEGDQVEVIVAWQERVIKTYIFKKNKSISIGSIGGADVFVPTIVNKEPIPLITFNESLVVNVPNGSDGIVVGEKGTAQLTEIKKKANATGAFNLVLQQKEMLVLKLDGGNIQIAIRYTKTDKKPLAAPLFDLTPSELVSYVMAGIIAFMFSIYMFVYSPEIDEEDKIEDKIRIAKISLRPPKIYPPQPMKVSETKASAPTQQKKADTPTTTKKQGKAGQVAKSKKKPQKKRKNLVGTNRAGGSKKTSKKSGGSAKSKRPDPTKSGLLGALTGGGVMDSIDKATSGSGELTGLANESTGSSGFAEDRPGEGVGFKGTGISGKGASAVGISDVGTRGKGTGILGSGTGGLGAKGRTNISLAGEEAFFEGTVDRDAVRRVILQNKRSIRYCYNRALRGNSTFAGKLVIRWVVVERGRVQKIKVVSNSTRDKVFGNCVMDRIRRLRFPEPPEDQEYIVSYPFLFNSQ